ncbi:Mavicyanin, putative [Ricinus communis]|uniref:Mavicyanin, putative n=1 Tax=Ricinus communis TaxID=3988 RepID=B9SLS7_RICCO|nr:Mavicyanin, putative [Ricinus communis]|eukprot:XP_002526946.1 early nodulin-like protein 1 [Ricinus communis]
MATFKLLLLLFTIFSSLHYFSVSSFEYQVGGNKGWVVPPANDTRIYNDWASENRFQVGDSIRFRYKKDSVMEVTEEEYKKCNSSHPTFFSNTGNTVYKLDHSGPLYFISGVSGHCQKGQKMVVKVMAAEEDYSSHGGGGNGENSGASPSAMMLPFGVSKVACLQLVLAYVASCIFY